MPDITLLLVILDKSRYTKKHGKERSMKKKISTLILCLLTVSLGLTGCTRTQMNEQIAESIGTLGMYENNEPVETPKMKAEKEIQEAKQEEEDNVSEHLDKAQRLAASYDYTNALAELSLINEDYQDDERVISAKVEYQRLQGMMITYSGDFTHFSVKSLIADKDRAFGDADMAYYYNNWSLTIDEFEQILQSLYEKNYILMSVYDLVVEVENEDGTISFALNTPIVPEGKTPIIFSFAEANYYSDTNYGAYSDKIVLADDGSVQNEYVDEQGNTLVGAYDVIPVLDQFVEEHPDFSLRGAKGIISLTGYEGVFGYNISTDAEEIKAIADSLKEDGWLIACNGYSNLMMESEMDSNDLQEDLDDWQSRVASLVGDTDLLFYPFGDSVSAGSYKQGQLFDAGYRFFFNLWATADYLEVNSDYVIQSRRVLDGYDLYYYGEDMTDFFDAKEILDPARPAFE